MDITLLADQDSLKLVQYFPCKNSKVMGEKY